MNLHNGFRSLAVLVLFLVLATCLFAQISGDIEIKAVDPSGASIANAKVTARNLDTGDELKWEVLKGDAITKANLGVKDVTAQSEIVVFRFAPVKAGESVRIRMFETYTDTARYKLVGDELFWDRSFGRPANSVVLPAGWMLTNSSVPATVTEQTDGRIRVDFINPRNDDIAVLLTARRRSK